MASIYEKNSEARKSAQKAGEAPDWMTTGGFQMFTSKISYKGETPRSRYETIAVTLGDIATELYGYDSWSSKFFDIIWKGWLSPSTPVLSNVGTDRGLPVSCSGSYVEDSIYGFYSSRLEAAILTQNGFGTSAYMGNIRHRGADISRGGKALGPLPVFNGFKQDMAEVSQGGVRRGSWAGYIEVDHPDFDEIADELFNRPDGLNIGWLVSDAFIDRLKAGDKEAGRIYGKIMKIRAVTGKGYMWFTDKVNRQNPPMYAEHGLSVKASNLCSEIALHSDEDHTYTCVLSSLNLTYWDEMKDTDAVRVATVFLDAVAELFMRDARKIKGLEKAVRFTEKSRALGLGVMGLHTLFQNNGLPFESLKAHMLNTEIFSTIRERAEEASKWMASVAGEPEWCKGYGLRNTHLMAVAPTMSTALLCGGVSQGIEPIVANVYNQNSAAGDILRVNPTLLEVMKERGVYSQETLRSISNDAGSVRKVTWLTDEEKEVFKTAFEINQEAILRMASVRQKYIDQGQSLNLFFSADEDPKYISDIHKQAMLDDNIKALYYMRSQAGVDPSKGACVACEG